MSYGRMHSEERRLKPEIAALLHQAEVTDQQEDQQFRAGRRRPAAGKMRLRLQASVR